MVGTRARAALKVSIGVDPMFGPVIHLSASAEAAEALCGKTVALPTLNRYLAADLISGFNVAALLSGAGNQQALATTGVEDVLLRVSEMACELPSLRELEIDPLVVQESGAVAVDSLVVVAYTPASLDPYSHMAIYPYPTHLTRTVQLPDGTEITIRPIRPEDAEMEQSFMRTLSDKSRYFRFMDALRELSQAMLVRFTQIDYDREMALVAVVSKNGADLEIGVARYVINPDGETCEFAIAVADEWQGRGIGSRLIACLIEVAHAKGLRAMEGEVLASNHNMLKLTQSLGFTATTSNEDPTVKHVVKNL
jgi:acetyltransferase